jgi:hypothetical protein
MENNHILEHARNLGFVARMNKKPRVPAQDPKVMENLKDRGNIKPSVWLNTWLEGWDECNLEEARYTRKAINEN